MNEHDWLTRTELLLGSENLTLLQKSHVLVAGLGGVGGYAAEAICRAGVGTITIVDSDVVKPSNRNRQLLALSSTEERKKVNLMAERLMDINPGLQLHAEKIYLKDEKISALLSHPFDYVIDAIDTLSPKVFFIRDCMQRKLPLISSMGAGGRLDPVQIRVADLSESYGCIFAHAVRKKLRGLGIKHGFKVIFSPEPVPKNVVVITEGESNKKSTVGTISYMPAMFGLTAASVAIRDLLSTA
jgi:tRNA A37 threonylcarbamoyladenosine dehydratase